MDSPGIPLIMVSKALIPHRMYHQAMKGVPMECGFDCAEFERYRVDLPYPDVNVGEPNPSYAAILSDILAGRGSETTAIAQYSAHRFFTQDYPAVYTAYKYIAYTEMTHFWMLGRLILQLGVWPKVRGPKLVERRISRLPAVDRPHHPVGYRRGAGRRRPLYARHRQDPRRGHPRAAAAHHHG